MSGIDRVGDPDAFPVLRSGVFFDHAAVAPLPAAVARAMHQQIDAWSTEGPQAWGYAAIDRVRQRAATLLGAELAEIALIPNTSTGLATVAAGLESSAHRHAGLGGGDVVVTTANEFPSNRVVWEDRRRDGCEVIVVPHDGHSEGAWVGAGHIDDAAIVATMREAFPRHSGTRLLAISHVQFATGQRHDIAMLADEAHRLGGLICVDAIQSLGQVPFDAHGWDLDFVAADGHKWLLGPEGAGVLMVRARHLDRVRPPLVGWLSVPMPLDYDTHQEELAPSARRYEPGCMPLTNVNGFAAALELILETGVERIARRLAALTDRLRAGLAEAGVEVVSPPFGDVVHGGGSGIVSFRPPGSSAADEVMPIAIADRASKRAQVPYSKERVCARRALRSAPTEMMLRLRERGVRVNARRGLVRLSPHFYNTEAQVDAAVEAIRAVVAA